jgi:hypothetical protein
MGHIADRAKAGGGGGYTTDLLGQCASLRRRRLGGVRALHPPTYLLLEGTNTHKMKLLCCGCGGPVFPTCPAH